MPKISRTRRLARPQATSTADYYPQTRADVSLAAAMLRRGREPAALLPPPRSPHRLPPGKPALPFELVDMILREAEYWTRSSVRKTRKSVVQQASPWMPYLESDPITDARRLRRMQINVVGHDQGWADNLSASYSFYELGWRRGGLDSQVTRGPRLFEHEVAKRERQYHRLSVYPDKHSENEMERWVASLETGDTICIMPSALYPGWANHTVSASIEVFSA